MKKPKYHKENVKVLETAPPIDQANKPSELIQINGHQTLSLYARRSITMLWHNAHRQGVEEGKDYTIEISQMVPYDKSGYSKIEEAVIQLMQTIITIKRPDGSTSRVQFLGGNDMDSETRSAGILTYSFDKRLLEILENSSIWGKISLPVLMSLSSKYGVSLYENVCQWAGLSKKTSQRFTVQEFRELLGVDGTKYATFGELNKHVVKLVVREINALAPFDIIIVPVKTGRKITHVHIGWNIKDLEENKLAWAEMNRSKVGRKARISDQVEYVLEPVQIVHKPSIKN